MTGHLLGVLEPSVVLQVNRDAGCPPGVTSDGSQKTRRLGSFSNCSPGIVPVKSSSGYCCPKRIYALEQRLSALKACGHNVLVQDLLEQSLGHELCTNQKTASKLERKQLECFGRNSVEVKKSM